MIHTLEFEVEYDFNVLGISCHARDYRMAWLLNRGLLFDLSRKDEIKVIQKNGSSLHSMYHCELDYGRIHIYLMRNRTESGYLMPEFAQMDYLLKVEAAEENEFKEIMTDIRSLDQVIYTLEIDPAKHRSGENLLF
jgi:hypothetical protein